MSAASVHRPIGVTILAILAGLAAVLAGIHLLQSLGILPYFIGSISVRGFSLWYAIMWGLLVWVYVWLIQMLWNVNPQGWLFLVLITVFNLMMDFIVVLGAETEWTDISVSVILNAIILAYVMLPGVRRSFQMDY
jgi:hypothetical protein